MGGMKAMGLLDTNPQVDPSLQGLLQGPQTPFLAELIRRIAMMRMMQQQGNPQQAQRFPVPTVGVRG